MLKALHYYITIPLNPVVNRGLQDDKHVPLLRFEGVPGEFLQIDWGEVRGLEFNKEGMEDAIPKVVEQTTTRRLPV